MKSICFVLYCSLASVITLKFMTKFPVLNASVTLTLRRLYGGRRTPKSSDSCGCRRNSAVAAGPPYGESLCFTGRKGGRRIIARSYNFFHIYVRHRNLSHRSHAVDASTATIRRTYGGTASVSSVCLTARSPYVHRTVPLRVPCVCLNICHKNYGCRRNALRRPCLITSKDVGSRSFQSHWLYGGRYVELQNRVIPAVAVEFCGGRRATLRRILMFYRPQGWPYNYSASYNFFNFYVRRRNLTRRNHAVDLDRTVAVRCTCGRLAYALIFVIKTTAAAGTPCGDRASSPQRT